MLRSDSILFGSIELKFVENSDSRYKGKAKKVLEINNLCKMQNKLLEQGNKVDDLQSSIEELKKLKTKGSIVTGLIQ